MCCANLLSYSFSLELHQIYTTSPFTSIMCMHVLDIIIAIVIVSSNTVSIILCTLKITVAILLHYTARELKWQGHMTWDIS